MSQSNSPDPGRSLERWLGGPVGATPPDDLDRDVVEAVYALRPDLAPAPRLTADDILATVTRGPLADPSRSLEGSLGSNTGAEVVPFPVRGGGASDPVTLDADPAPRRTHRLWKWVGGTGGIGMALVAAATLLLVVTPVLYDNRRSAPAPASDAASFGGSPGGASPGAVPTGAGPGAAAVGSGAGSLDDRADAPVAAAPPAEPPAIAAAPARGAAQAVGGEVSAPDVFPIARDGVVRGPSLIPELDERRAAEVDRSVAPAEVAAAPAASAPAQGVAAEAPAEAKAATDAAGEGEDLDALRSRAAAERVGTGWRKGVDPAALTRIDAAVAAGAPDAIASEMAGVPARAGQYLAGVAAGKYLAAGRLAEARAVAERGLGLSSARSAERDWLLVVIGDVRRVEGDVEGAAEAYRSAR